MSVRGAADRSDGSWSRAYTLVLAVLAADVVLLWLLGYFYA